MAKTTGTIVARILAFMLTIVAAIVMTTSSEEIYTDDYTLIAKFYYWSSFKYFLIANSIGGLYNLLVLLLPSGSMLWRLVVVLDTVVNILLSTSLAAAWESFSTVKNGNFHMNWTPVCPIVPNFCGKVFGALITGAIGFGVNFLLVIYSLHVILNPLLVPE